jgi:hypothetical protein
MMTRPDKVRALTKFFKTSTPLLKNETKVVFNITANGERVEPKGMTDKDFKDHVNALRTQYLDVLVWNEERTY